MAEGESVLEETSHITRSKEQARQSYNSMSRFYKKFPDFVDCRPISAQAFVEDAGFEVTGYETMSMWGLPVEIVLGRKGS